MSEYIKGRLPGGEDGLNVLEHYGIKYRSEEHPMIFESSELAKEFTALSGLICSAPRRFIIDFDPDYPFSVIRQMDMSKVLPGHENSQCT